MVTINVVSCHISAVYGRILKIPKATCHALSSWIQLYRFPILELALGTCNLICRLNLFAKKKLQTNQNISNLICWFVNFILQTLVSIEFVNSCSLQDWFHKHKLTCNTRMFLQHKFDKLCVSLPIKRNKIDWKGQ